MYAIVIEDGFVDRIRQPIDALAHLLDGLVLAAEVVENALRIIRRVG